VTDAEGADGAAADAVDVVGAAGADADAAGAGVVAAALLSPLLSLRETLLQT
jgi:hypothetical protein